MQLSAVLVVLSAVCVLTLSDTIVDPLTDAIRSGIGTILGAGGGLGLGAVSRPPLPFGSDTVGHFMVWTAVGVTAGGLMATTFNRFNLFLALFAFSAFLEVGQRYLSWSRSAEFSDLMANGIGLAVGFALYWAIEHLVMAADSSIGIRADQLVRRLVPWI